MWIKQFEPEIYQKTDKFLTTSSYLVHRLTGQYVIDMHTASYFSPLFNFEAMSWDDRYADGIVELQRLPKPVWCDGIAGEVTHAASSETGIPAGIPVTNGALDGLAESIGAGVIRPGQLMIMYGSTAGFYLPLTSLIRSNELWLLAGALKNQLAFGGGLATSGSATTWFRNQFGQDLVVNEEHGGVNAFAALAEIARQSKPGANGLIFLPYLSGERTPLFDPQARGIYAGLTLSHSRADLYRALLEGTAYAIRHNLEAIERTGALVDEIICVGGGANNRFWLQLVSDVCGIRQVIPNQTIGAAYGDAFLAGLASGLIPDISYLKSQWVHQADEVMPNPKAKPLYDQLYALFKSLYLDTKETTHMLANMQC